MQTVNIHQAKTNLSALLAAGRPFVIAKAGKPVANVTPIEPPQSAGAKLLGCLAGKATIPDDFNTRDQDEIVRLFEGR